LGRFASNAVPRCPPGSRRSRARHSPGRAFPPAPMQASAKSQSPTSIGALFRSNPHLRPLTLAARRDDMRTELIKPRSALSQSLVSIPSISFSRARQGVGGCWRVAQSQTHDNARSSVDGTNAQCLGFGPCRMREPMLITKAANHENSDCDQEGLEDSSLVHALHYNCSPGANNEPVPTFGHFYPMPGCLSIVCLDAHSKGYATAMLISFGNWFPVGGEVPGELPAGGEEEVGFGNIEHPTSNDGVAVGALGV
jgi:hypothetical protein